MKNTNKEVTDQIKNAYPVNLPSDTQMQSTVSMARQLLVSNKKYDYAMAFFIVNQIKNVSLFFWLIQFICFFYMIRKIPNISSIDDIRSLFALVVPILTLYILPELYKTYINNMTEIEAVCTHSQAKVTASKLIIISVSNFIVIVSISAIFGLYHQLNVLAVLCQGLIPFNIATSISLVFFDFVRLKSPHAMFAFAILLSFILTQLQNIGSPILSYWTIAFPVSVMALFVFIGLTLYRINHIKEWYYGT